MMHRVVTFPCHTGGLRSHGRQVPWTSRWRRRTGENIPFCAVDGESRMTLDKSFQLLSLSIAVARAAVVMEQNPIALGAVQTQERNGPCPKKLTVRT